ncbi:hypothetical protein D0Z03_001745 [Geotrichum reessii]|nr:hypothetical protein D0Z03_001745 [Galactomyces reessii]
MSKRAPGTELTRERYEDGEEENPRDQIDPVVKASSAIMNARKIAQPRVRRSGTVTSTTPSPALNPFTSFGATSSPAASNKPNPFAGFGSTSTTAATPSSSFSFSKPATASASEPIASTTPVPAATPSFNFTKKPESSSTAAHSFNVSKPVDTSSAPTFSFSKPAETGSTPSFNFGKPVQTGSTPSFNFSNPAKTSSTPPSNFSNPTVNITQNTASSFSFSKPAGSTEPLSTSSFSFGAPVTAQSKQVSEIKGTTSTSPLVNNAGAEEDETKLKFIALNQNLRDAVESNIKTNAYGDMTSTLQKYIEYAKTINSSASAPVAAKPTATTTTEAASDSDEEMSDDDDDKKPVEVKGPQFTLGALPKTKAKGPFLFGKEAEARAKREKEEFSDDSDDEIEVKGPQFTLNSLPTTKQTSFNFSQKVDDKPASVFGFGSQAAPKPEEKKEASALVSFGKPTDTLAATAEPAKPAFSFGVSNSDSKSAFQFSSNTGNSDNNSAKSGFSFSAPTSTDAAKTEISKPAFNFGNGVTAASTTAAPFKFGATATADKPASSSSLFGAATPAPSIDSAKPSPFSFGATTTAAVVPASASTKTTETKPAFSFSAAATPAASTTESSATKKPLFSVGSTTTTLETSNGDVKTTPFSFGSPSGDEPAKPAFSFGVPATGEKKDEAKPALSFGAPSSTKPFTFGAATSSTGGATSTTTPAFSFSKPAGSSTGAFSFGAATKPAAAVETGSTNTSATNGEPNDTSSDPQAQDLSQQKGPGEEEEDAFYEKRAKVFKATADGGFEKLGLGVLRILTQRVPDATNGRRRSRAVVRAEGSGRVILNVGLQRQLEYKNVKNQVQVIDFADTSAADGKPAKYFLMVKDGNELSDVMQKQKLVE